MEIKEHLWDDEMFAKYVDHAGDKLNVLLDLVEFKWTLTDQIKLHREQPEQDGEWLRKITTLVIRTKTRIAEMRRDLRAVHRGEEMTDAMEDLRDERLDDE